MVKESSICMALGMQELMWGAKTVASSTFISIGPYVLAAVIYFCINFPASKAIEAIERRMRRGRQALSSSVWSTSSRNTTTER